MGTSRGPIPHLQCTEQDKLPLPELLRHWKRGAGPGTPSAGSSITRVQPSRHRPVCVLRLAQCRRTASSPCCRHVRWLAVHCGTQLSEPPKAHRPLPLLTHHVCHWACLHAWQPVAAEQDDPPLALPGPLHPDEGHQAGLGGAPWPWAYLQRDAWTWCCPEMVFPRATRSHGAGERGESAAGH